MNEHHDVWMDVFIFLPLNLLFFALMQGFFYFVLKNIVIFEGYTNNLPKNNTVLDDLITLV
jgi:hypothetical protein